ncbi:gluconokinase [Croceitalea sp. MTPC9]|uniref:gluconokinase n=1 Tax=unclassified Croceitalea TaxID=2632280 RepID=UPI002B3E3713|nr:gluconokinase [Croceitalea sp. MTPC6]GMN15501.1 gluconokinase [Croceitalea sp. MTPC9]
MSKSILYIMGVSGTGKTTIGKLLAKTLQIPFYDGDDYHPKKNIEKMASGHALDDNDRYGWLTALNELAINNKETGAVIACSALKEKYRAQLQEAIEKESVFIYLKGTYDEIKSRLDNRKGHYMSSKLLKSQFDTLEEPNDAISVSIIQTPEQILQEILNQLK